MKRYVKLINKEAFKKSSGKCYFCPCDIYELLDCHRIIPGEQGGRYIFENVICACASCHRKIHSDLIKIFRKYTRTTGETVLHYIDENGIEHFN